MRGSRLHWFWRGAIALLVACIYGGLSVTAFNEWHEAVAEFVGGAPSYGPRMGVGVAVAWFAPVVLLALATYGLLTALLARRGVAGETRCRKCDYILRGISEPRCPECGERI